ncbi:MAG TPA: PH domain-containing protein [Longimicrobiales bacterium]|nr:PH domain-containing protein [Longimicrobiales bacterium]
MSETAPSYGGIIDPASAGSMADGVAHSLDPRWITYRRQVGWLKTAVHALLIAGATLFAVLLEFVPVAVAVAAAVVPMLVIAAVNQIWPAVAYRYAAWRLGARALEIRRGVLWRSVIVVPRSRIQHSDVSQGPLERMHGLGTLSVFTAGTKHALVRLHGLDHDRAMAIREHLLRADEDDVI